MKKLLIVLFAVASVVSASAAELVNYVEVSGKGEVKVAPNEFTVAIEVDEQATKGRYTVEEVERKMVGELKRLGISGEALKMSGLSSVSRRKQEALESAEYLLELSSEQQVVDVSDSFGRLGITRMKVVKFDNSDIESYRAEALAAAVKDAKERAKVIGEALGQRVGACAQFSERGSYSDNYADRYMMRASANEGVSERAALDYREITVTYNVSAKFHLYEVE